MVKYTLVYFNATGRGEVSRLLFAQAQVKYEDRRIAMDQWPALKSETPTGGLPYLIIDDSVKLGQSNAITRYLAREFSLYGSTSLESAKIDEIVDTADEFFLLTVKHFFADESNKEKALNDAKAKAPITLKYVEAILAKNGTGWLVGAGPTLADFHVFNMLPMFGFLKTHMPDEQAKYTKITEHRQRVSNLPNIKKYLAERPETPF